MNIGLRQIFPNSYFFKPIAFLILLFFILDFSYSQGNGLQSTKQDDKRETTRITEEIVVIGEAPRDIPISSITTLDMTQMERTKPVDLAEAVSRAPGVFVTFGNKSEYTLKIRGIDSRRIALLLDGIPVYEPYFSSFDLKTVAAAGVDTIQVTKGPSSVLYGSNTLGGIVNVITRRPQGETALTFQMTYGERNTLGLGADAAWQSGPYALTGNFIHQNSDGFFHADKTGGRTARENSDYRRTNLNLKGYYNPSDRTEIMLNVGVYKSSYGMPYEIGASRPRYWRFKNWDRYSLNAGGFTAVGKDSFLRFRAYMVQYDNTLDAYFDREMTLPQFRSTYDNTVYGFFSLGDFYLGGTNRLKSSLNVKGDRARIQSDSGADWELYNQGSLSLAVEDQLVVLDRWKLVAGISLDYLDKIEGKNRTRLNPLIGVSFSPSDRWAFHLSTAIKSRFPSMRSLYDGVTGNPDLLSETGRSVEFGFSYLEENDLSLGAALFYNSFHDMIDSLRFPDGTRRYFNIDRARVFGLEMESRKGWRWGSVSLSYTYLDHRNISGDRPLDAIPAHTFYVQFFCRPIKILSLSLSGIKASESHWLDTSSQGVLVIPSYFSIDCIVSAAWKSMEIFFKAGNLLNQAFYTEPGYPWRGRYLELGIKTGLL